MLDRLRACTRQRHRHNRIAWALIALLTVQVLLGAAVHHHLMGDHAHETSGAIHGDFAHEWHADQHGVIPDGLMPDIPADLPPVLLAIALFVVMTAVAVRRLPWPRERYGGPSPPRYCLPQPRDPPFLRLT